MDTAEFRRAQAEALRRHGIEAEERTLDTPATGGRAHVLVTGHGPPAVLVNGIGTPAAMWAPLMGRLEGFTLHAVDLPGFGLTEAAADHATAYRARAARFLREVLDGLGLDAPHVVANSLGSLWSLWLALEHPGRVASLTHVGCPALVLGTSAPLPMRLLSLPWLGPLLLRLDPPSARQVERLSTIVREHPLPPEVADLLLATERLAGFEATFLSTLRTLLRLRGARPEMALDADALGRIPHPTLLVFGDRDPMGARAVGERLARALPDARLHMVAGGHAPYIHRSAEIAPLINTFLAEVEAQRGGPPRPSARR
ncbi:MAG: alpha/beta fold hydrolase [Sandaracinaceae bacterium]